MIKIWTMLFCFLYFTIALQAQEPADYKIRGWIADLQFGSNSKTIYSASYDSTFAVWSLQGEPLDTINCMELITNAVVSPDGRFLATMHMNGYVGLWDITAKKNIFMKSYTNENYGLVYSFFTGDSKKLLVLNPRQSSKGLLGIKLYSLENEIKQIQEFQKYFVGQLRYSPKSNRIAFEMDKKEISIYNPITGKDVFTSQIIEPPLKILEMSPIGNSIAYHTENWIRIVRFKDGIPAQNISIPEQNNEIYKLKFTPSGKELLSLSKNGDVVLYNAQNGKKIHNFGNYGDQTNPWRVYFEISENEKYMAIGHNKNQVEIWDLKKRKLLNKLNGSTHLLAMQFSPNNKYLLLSEGYEGFYVWDIRNAKSIKWKISKDY
jgi:WD40 repeat protein